MHKVISRWFLFGLLLGWAMTQTDVLAQNAATTTKPAPTPPENVRAKLNKNITVDFTGQNLTEVLNHLQDKIGVKIHVDPMVLMMGPDVGVFNPNGNPVAQPAAH